MKASVKILLPAIIAINLISCRSQVPISKITPDNNKTYRVEYLFEHDGCKVYRFYDLGHYVYFTNCNGEVISTKKDSTGTSVVNVVRNNVLK